MTRGALKFVVVASPKSGTTWVQRLISAHPAMHCGESRLFGRYYDPSNPTGPHTTIEQTTRHLLRHLSPPDVGEDFGEKLAFGLVDTIAGLCAQEGGVRLYGEKFTPYPGTAEGALEMLARYNDETPIVHLVRDGRDVIVSGAAHRLNIARQRWAGGMQGAGSEDLEAAQQLADRVIPDRWFEHFLSNWIDLNTAMLECGPMFRSVLRVSYEDLLAEPETQTLSILRHIASGTDVAVTPGQAEACAQAASFQSLSGGRSRGQEDRESFFRKGVAGDWENWFTVDQLHEFDERAGELLEALGYDRGAREHAA